MKIVLAIEKTVKTLRSSYEEKLKCSPSVFNVWLTMIFRRSSSSLARFDCSPGKSL